MSVQDEPQHVMSRSFSVAFDIDVDAIARFAIDCQMASGTLRTASEDADRARSIVAAQSATLVDDCISDLSDLSVSCSDVSQDLRDLKEAASTFASALRTVRDEYRAIREAASAGGLAVSARRVTLVNETDAALTEVFSGLQTRALEQETNYNRAEFVFGLALEKLRVDAYEKVIQPLYDALRDSFVPAQEYLPVSVAPAVDGVVGLGERSARAYSIQTFRKMYQVPEGFLAKGDLSKWSFSATGRHGLEPTGTRSVAPLLGKVGKVTGVVGAVADGGITAYQTYQTDTVQHPEWSEEHKVARATVKGGASGGLAFAGGLAGAKLGAAVGAACSGPFAPVGAVVGGLVGGVVGGLIGHHFGETIGGALNEQVVDRVAGAAG